MKQHRFIGLRPFTMHRIVLQLFLMPVLLLFFSTSDRMKASVLEAAGAKGGVAHACDVLSVEIVKSVLGITDLDARPTPGTTRSGKRKPTYTSCKLVWPSDKKMEREIMGHRVMVDAENRINLSVSIFEPGSDQNAYNTGAKVLKEKFETEPVEGVGDEALWVPKMKQLSVRGGGHVFHLSVEYADGEGKDLDYTKKMAQRILQELG